MSLSACSVPGLAWWIASEDFAKQVAKAFSLDSAINKEYSIQGLEGFTTTDAIHAYVENHDRKQLKVANLPMGMGKFLALFIKPLKFAIPLIETINNDREQFEAEQTWKELGKPQIDLKTFAKRQFNNKKKAMNNSTEAQAIAQKYFDAVASRNVEAAVALCDDKITTRSPLGNIEGIQAFRAFTEGFAKMIIKMTPLAILGGEDKATIVYIVDTFPVQNSYVAEYLTIGNGKINSNTTIHDSVPFQAYAAKQPKHQ